MRRSRTITTGLIIPGLLLLIEAASADTLATGLDAFEEGDHVSAFSAWLPLAEAGNREAQLYIAYMYRRGMGVAKSPDAAAHWYGQAARQGDANAQYELGLMYELGLGLARDSREAAYWYGQAESQGVCPGELRAGGILGD